MRYRALGGRTPGRLLAYVLILGAVCAYPFIDARTGSLLREAEALNAQRQDLERAHADIDALRSRVARVQALSDRAESLLEMAGPSLVALVPFSRRQLAVTQQTLSRSQAEAWLHGFDASAAGFLVIDAFSIKVTSDAGGLFDEIVDPNNPGQLLVSLKGEYIGRNTP